MILKAGRIFGRLTRVNHEGLSSVQRMARARVPSARRYAGRTAMARIAVEFDGHRLEAGERRTPIWAAAKRDEAVSGDPHAFDLQRNRDNSRLYGAGVHVCPGAPLARLELCLLMARLLANSAVISPAPAQRPARAGFPASGLLSLTACLQ